MFWFLEFTPKTQNITSLSDQYVSMQLKKFNLELSSVHQLRVNSFIINHDLLLIQHSLIDSLWLFFGIYGRKSKLNRWLCEIFLFISSTKVISSTSASATVVPRQLRSIVSRVSCNAGDRYYCWLRTFIAFYTDRKQYIPGIWSFKATKRPICTG